MRLIADVRGFLDSRIVPFRAPILLVPDPATPCAICLEKVAPDGWSSEPVPTCRSCWPLLAWFRGLYTDLEDAETIGRFDPETRFIEDISFDSLDYIGFLAEAEESFGVRIRDEDAERFRTVSEFLRYIRDSLRLRDDKPLNPTTAEMGSLWDRDLDG